MENYNPKQRKLRNLIIEGQAEGQDTQSPSPSTLSPMQAPPLPLPLPLALTIQEDSDQQQQQSSSLTLPDPGLEPGGFAPVVEQQEAGLVGVEDGGSGKAPGVGDGAPGNTAPVSSGVLQHSQLDPSSYTTVVVL